MKSESLASKPKTETSVPTQIKDPQLVTQRRDQIITASVKLFIEQGYHKTTTRQIAKAAGFSIGSLYEYVTSKEDVLYLVCDSIHMEVEKRVAQVLSTTTPNKNALIAIIREFFLICHRMSDHILLMYQVTQFLPAQWQKKVLDNEIRITNIFSNTLRRIREKGALPFISDRNIDLIANNISVLGHSWAFRRWYFSYRFSIEEYTHHQTATILGMIENVDHAMESKATI